MRALAAVLFLALSEASDPAADRIAAGRAALDRGDLDEAVTQLEKAAALQPASFEAHYRLGWAYARKTQDAGLLSRMSLAKKTKAEFARAVEINPDSIEARFRLIEFYTAAPGIAGGSEAKAQEQAAEVRKRDSLEGHRAYARILSIQKKLDLAAREVAEGVREQPRSAKAHYFLGNALLNMKDWPGSLREYETTLSSDESYMPAYFRIGQLAVQSGSNSARGEEALRRYLGHKPAEDEPGLGRAWYWLGMIQEKQGRKADARESYGNAKKLDPASRDVAEAIRRVS